MNTGTLITHDRSALQKWLARRRQPPTPAEQTATVYRLAGMFPGKVKTQ